MEIGALNQLAETQKMIYKIFSEKISGRSQPTIPDARAKIEQASSKRNPTSSGLQARLSRKRHKERIICESVCAHSSQWPNQTKPQQAPSKPIFIDFPMPSAETLEIMRETPKDSCTPVPLPKKPVK